MRFLIKQILNRLIVNNIAIFIFSEFFKFLKQISKPRRFYGYNNKR
jgi:hypothetical protein